MRHAWLAVALLMQAAAVAAQSPTIPETPAGRLLSEWLEVFNGGDRTEILAFLERYRRPEILEAILSFRSQTGGVALISIEHSTPETIEFVARERVSETRLLWRLAVSGDPPRAALGPIEEIPPGATNIKVNIDAATRDAVIDAAIAKLREFYVFEDAAEAMAASVERRRRNGDYDRVTSGLEFASLLTTHFRDVSHDLHLNVTFTPVPVPRPTEDTERDREDLEDYRKEMARVNCGFEKVEILQGNVGYLKFNMFASPEVCGPTATAAMNFLGHVNALIVDLRENGGGSPAMVAYVTSYLFDEPTHLNDLYNRTENSTQQWWTLPYVPGGRLADQPVYVLTSRRTFSGAEEFSYNLKSLGRATIVGETTGGGAHPVRVEWLTEHFTMRVPFARAINPITKTNWEGTGVEPDVVVPAAEAFDRALELVAGSRSHGGI
jgi:Peptidase family S41/N-terminal domain of Peptidase_S41 in eukaryotic IRBP